MDVTIVTPWQSQMMSLYGTCELCGGPRSDHTTAIKDAEEWTVMFSLRCLHCGYRT